MSESAAAENPTKVTLAQVPLAETPKVETPKIRQSEKFGFLTFSGANNIIYQFRSIYHLLYMTNVLKLSMGWAGMVIAKFSAAKEKPLHLSAKCSIITE
jgi:hypothetical protein